MHVSKLVPIDSTEYDLTHHIIKNTTKFRLLIKHIKKILDDGKLNCSHIELCENLIANSPNLFANNTIANFFCSADVEEQHYWIGNLYTNLISDNTRKELAAFFTPPYLSHYAINRLTEFGLDIARAKILDPASGGAAFLSPLALSIIAKLKKRSWPSDAIGKHLSDNIRGIEIDVNLAHLSRIMLHQVITQTIPKYSVDIGMLVSTGDSLVAEGDESCDLVISNPPYGRVFSPSDAIYSKFKDVLTDRYVNKYALFMRLAIDWTKPGGYIALIVPTSFIAGPYFAMLRATILRETAVMAIDLIEKRADTFFDVSLDTCIVFLKKNKSSLWNLKPSCRLIHDNGTFKELGNINIPDTPCTRPWVLPSELRSDLTTEEFFSSKLSKLEGYGYGVRAGYFVWNREKHRSREGVAPKNNEYPLIWAHSIKANMPCLLETHRSTRTPNIISFVRFDNPSNSLINKSVIIMQRTSNKHQPHRLIAGYVPQETIDKYGCVVSENHTIVIYPLEGSEQLLNIKQMCRLLNSKPVDYRFRQISGTVSVSVKLLNDLPLPLPSILIGKINWVDDNGDSDDLIEQAYHGGVC